MPTSLIVVAPASFAVSAAAHIADLMQAAIAARGQCAIALCGGTTPGPVLEALGKCGVRWSDLLVFFGDERAVPPVHPDSNFGLARRALLDHVPIPAGRIHRMEADRIDLDVAALDYEARLPDPLDVLLLGIGIDGHTASLFPGSPAVRESRRRVVAVPPPPPPVVPRVARMTITPPVIAAARHVVVMATGSAKAGVLAGILEGPERPEQLPAQLARGGTWILDTPAAKQLHQKES
jgi:6-phosphogluconolactonase